MTKRAKRKYNAASRRLQADQTRDRILDAARRVISHKGFADATFEAIAAEAGVAAPTVYAAFGSKSGILRALMGRATFSSNYDNVVREALKSDDPVTRLRFAARIARGIFDSLRSEAEVLRGATAIAPDFIRERERIRYERQEGVVQVLDRKGRAAHWSECAHGPRHFVDAHKFRHLSPTGSRTKVDRRPI